MGQIINYILLGNAAVIAAYICALLIERTAILFNLRTAYRLRSHLAVAALCTAALPLALTPILPIFTSLSGVTGTDLIVAQYLKGNISLSATQMSEILSAKNSFMLEVFGGKSMISKTLILFFILAAVSRLLYIGINVVKIRKHINESVPHFRTRRIVVSISNNSIIPYSTRGLFKYHILIPENLVSDPRAFRIALGHEAQHIRQGDVNWEILLTLASPLFILNPAFWLLSDRVRRFREYACDAAFLKKNTVDARYYCLLLLHFASRASRDQAMKSESVCVASVQFGGQGNVFNRGRKSVLRKRIIALSQGSAFADQGIAKYVNLAPALLLVTIISVGVIMAAKPAKWSHDRIMLSTVANLERLNRINGFGVPPLR